MHRPARGFTLWEMTIVLAVMAISAALVAPALLRDRVAPQAGVADGVLNLLRETRRAAIEKNATTTLRIDPVSGHFRVDTAGVYGTGVLAEGTLSLDATQSMVTDLSRLLFVFRPSGAAFSDSVMVRGSGASAMVTVDPWSGMARADAR